MFTSMSSQFFRALIPLCAAALLCGCGAGAEEDTATAKALAEHQGEEQLDGSGSGDGECYGCGWMNMCSGCSLEQNEEIEATAVLNALGGLPLAAVEASGPVRGIVVNSATQGTTSRMALSNAEQDLATQGDSLQRAVEKFIMWLKSDDLEAFPSWREQRDQIAAKAKALTGRLEVIRSYLENGKCNSLTMCEEEYAVLGQVLSAIVAEFLNAKFPENTPVFALQEQLRVLLTDAARRATQQIVARDSVTTDDGAFRVGIGAGTVDGKPSLTRLAATAAGKPASASPNQGTGRLVAPKLWSTAATQRGAGTVNVITQQEQAASSSSPLIQVDIRPAGSCDEGGACSFTADARYFSCGTDMWAFCTPRSAQCTPAAEQGCHRGFLSSLFSSSFVLPTIHQQCKLWCSYAGQEQGGLTVTVSRSALQNMEENRAVVEPVPLVGPGNLVVNPVVNPVNPPLIQKYQYRLEVAFAEPGFDKPTWFKGDLDVDQDGNLLRVGGEINTPYLEQNCAVSCPVQRHKILLGAQASEMESKPFINNSVQTVATPGKLWTVYLDAANSPVHGKARSPDPRANPSEPYAPAAGDDGNAWLRFFLPNPEFLKNGKLSWGNSEDAENGLPSHEGAAYADCSWIARTNDNCLAAWHEDVEGVPGSMGGVPVCWRLTTPAGDRFTSGDCPGN